jgi:hypothetical protein
MSLSSFQLALADLAASPALGLAARRDPAVFGRYDLTERERRRLQDVVEQPGLPTHCALERARRLSPLHALLPTTCLLLGDRLAGLADAFWQATPEDAREDLREVDRFAEYLRGRLDTGALEDPYLEEVLDFEQALNELKLAPRGLALPVRVLAFQHDPAVLLGHIALGTLPGVELPAGLHFLAMRAEGGRVSFATVAPPLLDAEATRR